MNRDEIISTIEEHALIYTYLKYGDAVKGSAFMINHLWKKRERLINESQTRSKK